MSEQSPNTCLDELEFPAKACHSGRSGFFPCRRSPNVWTALGHPPQYIQVVLYITAASVSVHHNAQRAFGSSTIHILHNKHIRVWFGQFTKPTCALWWLQSTPSRAPARTSSRARPTPVALPRGSSRSLCSSSALRGRAPVRGSRGTALIPGRLPIPAG